jgi:hypothetical protein
MAGRAYHSVRAVVANQDAFIFYDSQPSENVMECGGKRRATPLSRTK